MSKNSVFNATICIVGILILMIHVVNLISKKGKRKDEKILLDFFIFTILHFATYLTFTLIKFNYTSNAFIIAFYTTFYIMNNIEVFLLFRYARVYIGFTPKKDRVLSSINITAFSVFVLLDIINIFTKIFFTAEGGVYVRSKTMILSQGYQFIMFAIIFIVAVSDKKLNLREKTAFALYCTLPLVAIVLQNIFKGYAIAYASIIIAIEMLFFFLNVQKNIELAKQEEKNKDAQIKIMLSQIQPHFIYNALTAILALIPMDPPKAQSALNDFTRYLRMNLSSLTATRLIPFENELKHIQAYVSLEQLRFGERLKVVYDIQTTDFDIPPLSIQPLVENAIKHGIMKKVEGGTLIIKTYELPLAFIVEIKDDGVGFCLSDIDFEENNHFGLQNIKYRLNKICQADMDIQSEIGKGTTVTVTFIKQGVL